MNILVIGGTRYIGVHLVRQLLSKGYQVTIANRGQTTDDFKNKVNRILLERSSPESIYTALKDKYFDVVYDSLAYSSNEIKYLLDSLNCGRYIQTSTLSVYPEIKMELTEEDFNPLTYPLKWCSREDFSYDEVKRQAECALFQHYSSTPAVAVRFPYVIGEDDYTRRLFFYIEHIALYKPMNIDNLKAEIAFVHSSEAGIFLAWLADKNFTGSINASSYGTISLSEIICYAETKMNKKAILSPEGEPAPYNGTPNYSMDLNKSEKNGYRFSNLKQWIYGLIDKYIDID